MSDSMDSILGTLSCLLLILFVLGMIAGTRTTKKVVTPSASLGRFQNDHWTVEVYGDIDRLERTIHQVVGVDSFEHISGHKWVVHLDYRNDKGDAQYVVDAINRATNL